MKVKLAIVDSNAAEDVTGTNTEDDFFYMKDSISQALEPDWGARFPHFMKDGYPDQVWQGTELKELVGELEVIVEECREKPPEPLDSNWQGKMSDDCKSLYDVFVDTNGQPILGELLRICKKASEGSQAVQVD